MMCQNKKINAPASLFLESRSSDFDKEWGFDTGSMSDSGPTSSPGLNQDTQTGGTEVLPDVQVPKMYSVILLNDDFSPMDFVILVLRRFFGHKDESATQIMLDVHRKGAGIAGVYTLEIAEMKTMQVNQFSQMHQHPLKCTMQEAPS